ncbi:MAG: hypothetical protein R3C26_15720 [Calditrichia bacterium]
MHLFGWHPHPWFNSYPFPWQTTCSVMPSVALGIFEGHMAKMAEGFKAVRMAELN